MAVMAFKLLPVMMPVPDSSKKRISHHKNQNAQSTGGEASPRVGATGSVLEQVDNNNVQIQPSHGTAMNRYPEQYTFLRDFLATQETDNQKKKILSFGCSTGEEPLTLATQYFPETNVHIFGVDVADLAIQQATALALHQEAGKITILDGRKVSPAMYGPFDIVTANSVFCIYGFRKVPFQNITYVMETFPFESFQNMLQDIDSYLKIGGILVVFNSNYNFMDTALAQAKYQPIFDKKCPNHFVPRIDRTAKRFINVEKEPIECLYTKVK